MMPELHGFQVCKTLREDDEFSDTPIIVLTALNDTLDRTKAFELGVDDFIAKPFHNAELLTRIRRRLSQNKTQQTFVANRMEWGTEIFALSGSAYRFDSEKTEGFQWAYCLGLPSWLHA